MNEEIANLLRAQLHDLHAPQAVGWWPPAFGWWLLGAMVIAVGIMLYQALRRYRQRTAPRRIARRELNDILQTWHQDADPMRYLQSASRLLRGLVLTRVPRREAAGVHGAQWAALLDSQSASPLPAEVRNALIEDCYRSRTDVPIDVVHAALLAWLRRMHGRPGGGGEHV